MVPEGVEELVDRDRRSGPGCPAVCLDAFPKPLPCWLRRQSFPSVKMKWSPRLTSPRPPEPTDSTEFYSPYEAFGSCEVMGGSFLVK